MTSFRILGPVEMWHGQRSLPVGGRRQAALLAYLLIHPNRAVSSDALIDAVWGASRSGADNRLHMAVGRLRRALGPLTEDEPRIRTVGRGYLLSLQRGELDADEFEAQLRHGQKKLADGEPARAVATFEAALALWRGPPLPEVAFEEFAQAEIRRLTELRIEALESRIEAQLRLGGDAQLVSELEGLLGEFPTRERLASQLMLALYRCGRQADALAVYQRIRGYLAEQLGLEPGAALRAREAEILGQAASLNARGPLDPDLTQHPAGAGGGGSNATKSLRAAEPPLLPTPTIGREREIDSVCELLVGETARLVTLTGAGGVGKTRIALAVAHRLQSTLPDGACWVELAGVAQPDDVAMTIAHSLAVAPVGDETISEALRHHLSGSRMVLVIDNFEHVVEASVIVGDLLATAAGLRVLTTSREPLNLAGEHRIAIAPLRLAREHRDTSVIEIEAADASALFLAAVRRRDSGFVVTAETAPVIARICARLDGLPLALELAAGRVHPLGVQALAKRLEPTGTELGTGPRNAPARQRTLAAAIDWSYELLEEDEARAFTRFSVFAGGATPDAARAVTSAAEAVVDSLVEKSLIDRRARPDGSPRLMMLETIRQYAVERFARDDDRERVRRCHAEWFLALAERANEHLHTTEQAAWAARLHAETDNLRAVLAWSLELDIARGVELTTTLFYPWVMRGQHGELAVWLESATSALDTRDIHMRAETLKNLGKVLLYLDQHESARPKLQECLTLFRAAADRSGEADTLIWLGYAAGDAGSLDEAIMLSEQGLSIYRELGDRVGTQLSLHALGEGLRDNRMFDRAGAVFEEAATLAQELGDRYALCRSLHSYGDSLLDRNDLTGAADRYRETLTVAIEIDDERDESACLAGLACVAARAGNPFVAGRLWAAATEIRDRYALAWWGPSERARYERVLAPLGADRRFQEGRASSGPVEKVARAASRNAL